MHKVFRTLMLSSAGAMLAVAALVPITAHAQKPANLPGGYPAKPVRVMIGLAPGGGVDILVRAMTQKLGEKWSAPFVVENRPTAGGTVALEMVANAAPDGYTWLASGSQTELTVVYQRSKIDVLKALEPVVQMTSQPYLLVVPAALPVNSVKELIELAKSKPGGLNYATAGNGSSGHLGHEYFNAQFGLKMTHIPYKGGGASLTDLIAGRTQLSFLTTISGTALVKKGAVRALAVTSPKRLETMPDLPTVSEAAGIRDFEMANNYGLFITAQSPVAIINAINRDVTQVLFLPDLKARLNADGAEPQPAHTPAQYRAAVEGRIARWAGVVKASGITPDE